MDKVLDWLRYIAAAAGGIAAYLWGAWDALIIVLVCVVVLDYITGVCNAGLKHELSSMIGFKGIMKKVFIFALVALGTLADRVIPITNGALRSAVILFYIANEGLSILENAGELGLPLPGALKKALEKLKTDSGESKNI
ncbi:MAG: phage holin family protein [Clostridia bacterium]